MRLAAFLLLLCGAFPAWAQPYAYIPGFSSNDVSVIDTATGTVVGTVAVGTSPWGVSVAPDYSRVYITNLNSADVSVIDTATNTVVDTIPVGPLPYTVSISPDGSQAYVPSFDNDSITILDLASGTVSGTIAGVGDAPYHTVFSPDGSRAYVSLYLGAGVAVIDTTTEAVITTIPVTPDPLQLAITPDGAKIYVSNENGSPVDVIDTGTNTVIDSIAMGGQANGVAISPDGQYAYFAIGTANQLGIVFVPTDALITTVPVGSFPWGVAVHPAGTHVYTANAASNNVSVVDLEALSATNIAVGSQPYATGFFLTPATGAPPPPPLNQGVELDAVPGAPITYAAEIVASPGSPVTLLNPAGDLNLSAALGYNFSIGEVRYARFECDNGLHFNAGSAATYDGTGDALLGAINGLGASAMHFSITANDNGVVETDRLVITGERSIVGTEDVTCTYSLYDFPSQAAAGGEAGRVYTVSGPYIDFAASYGLRVDEQGHEVADVESPEPAFSEFVFSDSTFDTELGQLGEFHYASRLAQGLGPQPLSPAGTPVLVADLMHADTALVFTGDFSAASDVFISPNSNCSVNWQSADDFNEVEAVFTIGSTEFPDRVLCFVTDGQPIPASDYTIALDAVSLDPAAYAVADLGPLALGRITRNGTELQAPLAQVPDNYLSRVVLTNTGPVGRAFRIEAFGETGNTITTGPVMSGIVAAESTRVIDLRDILTGFSLDPRATIKLTVAAPNSQIQGLYQIVNPNSGTISNHVMVRPGTN